MRIIRRAAFTTVPWKNGGGVTHEALRVPVGAVHHQFRISVAEIDASGPFSDFAGYRRHVVLLQGAGLRLRFSNGARAALQRVGDLVEFDGSLQTECDLIDGACVDLNLLTSKAIEPVEARVERLASPLELAADPAATFAVFCICGSACVAQGAGDAAALDRWDLAVFDGAAGALQVQSAADRRGEAAVFLAKLANP
ncbi:MAG TPA: HutD family protein [Steroidobacteraceae bacterium]|nr:HutD family protein [Steroidobacteraceae bacterium]